MVGSFKINSDSELESVICFKFDCTPNVRVVEERVHQHVRVMLFVGTIESILSPAFYIHLVCQFVIRHYVEASHKLGREVERGEKATSESSSGDCQPVFVPYKLRHETGQSACSGPGILLSGSGKGQSFANRDNGCFREIQSHRGYLLQHGSVYVEKRTVCRRMNLHVHRAFRQGR